MLAYVRPSNEALLRARVPGAQDQRGCPFNPSYRARSASMKDGWLLPIYSFLLSQVLKHTSHTPSGDSYRRRNVYVFAD
jgi:hypothetical protein